MTGSRRPARGSLARERGRVVHFPIGFLCLFASAIVAPAAEAQGTAPSVTNITLDRGPIPASGDTFHRGGNCFTLSPLEACPFAPFVLSVARAKPVEQCRIAMC